MSGPVRDRMKQGAELVRKGAVILSEPCQQCGGILVRYHGKVYCTNHEDLSQVLKREEVSFDTIMAGMNEVLLAKLNESAHLLEVEKDLSKQDQLVTLMAKLYNLLQQIPRKQHSA